MLSVFHIQKLLRTSFSFVFHFALVLPFLAQVVPFLVEQIPILTSVLSLIQLSIYHSNKLFANLGMKSVDNVVPRLVVAIHVAL